MVIIVSIPTEKQEILNRSGKITGEIDKSSAEIIENDKNADLIQITNDIRMNDENYEKVT